MADTEMTGWMPRNVWERHFQTFVGIAMMALGAWLFSTVSNQTVTIAVQTQMIEALTARFDTMEALLANSYTASDAAKDFALRDSQISRIKLDILDLGQHQHE